jgi:hypothetical protein
VVEALRLFDDYHFRIVQQEAKTARHELVLSRPPQTRSRALRLTP